MFEKREIISALEIGRENRLDKKFKNFFDKHVILNLVNKARWKQGASELEGTFMTEQKFERIIQNRKFFCTINKIGLK